MTDSNTGGELGDRTKRGRLLSAVLSALPTEDLAGYGERSERYFDLIAKRPEEQRTLTPLLGLVVSRWASALRRWRRLIDERMRERGQSQIRWHILWEVATNPAGQTLKSVAARMGVMSASLVGLIDELEADGLIERNVDENDRRSKFLVLTPEGERCVSWMYELAADLRWEFFQGVSEAELLILLDVIDVMRTNLDRLTGEP